jgi:acyl-CoA thioester hydrolase
MSFSLEIPVRFRDIDGMGHVNNAVVFTYMEQARSEWYRHLMGITSVAEFDFILAHASCDFMDAIGFGETVVVTVTLTKIGDSSFRFAYEVRSKESGTLYATGESVQVCYDYKRKRPMTIPPGFRKKLTAELPKLSRRSAHTP